MDNFQIDRYIFFNFLYKKEVCGIYQNIHYLFTGTFKDLIVNVSLSVDSIQRLFDDPTAELCRYRLRAVFFSVALLHENPSNKVDLDSGTKADNRNNMKTIATQYFQKMHSFSAASGKEVKALRAVFAEALPQDHLRFDYM